MTLEDILVDNGYTNIRKLPDGRYIGVCRLMFTYGLCYGLDYVGRDGRYCYEREIDATMAAELWDGEDDPPGPWIKHKARGVDRLNPKWAKDEV